MRQLSENANAALADIIRAMGNLECVGWWSDDGEEGGADLHSTKLYLTVDHDEHSNTCVEYLRERDGFHANALSINDHWAIVGVDVDPNIVPFADSFAIEFARRVREGVFKRIAYKVLRVVPGGKPTSKGAA